MTGTSLFPAEPGPAFAEAVLAFGPRTKISECLVVETTSYYDLLWWEFADCHTLKVAITLNMGKPA